VSAWFSIVLGVAWRVLWKIVKNPALLAPQLIFPLFFFTAFAGGLSGLDRLPSFDFPPGYTAFVFVFVLLQSAAFGGVFTGFGIASDFEWGFARRLFLAAPWRSAIVAGYALAALGRWAATGALLTGVALLTGMPMPGSAADIVGLYTLALLVNVAALLWASGVAMRFRTLQAGPVMQMPTFMILFFAPVYVPLDLLDGWLKASARVNPLTQILEAGRSLLAGTPSDVLAAYGIAAAIIVGFGLWALRGLRSAERAAA
jgi:ABC-2 type transport system permease protein